MQVIVINSQKGGSGKTMLAKHLAVEAERAGDGPVYLIDTDPQSSLSACHDKREAKKPARIDVAFDKLPTPPPVASTSRGICSASPTSPSFLYRPVKMI